MAASRHSLVVKALKRNLFPALHMVATRETPRDAPDPRLLAIAKVTRGIRQRDELDGRSVFSRKRIDEAHSDTSMSLAAAVSI